MRRIALAGMLASLAIGLVAAPAMATNPKADTPPDSVLEFAAGDVCEFAVMLEGWSNERVRIVQRNGLETTVITGNARTRVTRLDETGGSVLLVTGGRVAISEPGDDTSRATAHGRTLFYFFPGDQTPAGEGSGLFLVIGSVHQTLDLNQNLVTVFDLAGRYRDICAELA